MVKKNHKHKGISMKKNRSFKKYSVLVLILLLTGVSSIISAQSTVTTRESPEEFQLYEEYTRFTIDEDYMIDDDEPLPCIPPPSTRNYYYEHKQSTDREEPSILYVDAWVPNGEFSQPAQLTLSVAGKDVALPELDNDFLHSVFEFTAEELGDEDYLSLVLETDQTFIPARKGDSLDARELGVMVKKILFRGK